MTDRPLSKENPRQTPAVSENKPAEPARGGTSGRFDSNAKPGSGGADEQTSMNPGEEEKTGSAVLPDEVVDEERLVRSHPGDREDDAT